MQPTLVFTTKAKSLVAIQLWLDSRQVSLCYSSASQWGHELWALDQLENLQVAQHLQFSHLHPPGHQQWMITAPPALILSSVFSISTPQLLSSSFNLFWKGRFAGHFEHHFYPRHGQKQVLTTCGSPALPRHRPFPTMCTRQDLTKQETTEAQKDLEKPIIKCNN